MSTDKIKYFSIDNKPDLKEVGTYFSQRISGKEAGIRISRDVLGNQVFCSLGKREPTLDGEFPATLIVSESGRSLLASYPGILKDLNDPHDLPFIGSGSEGNVYKITLNTPTSLAEFAIKYYFPINRDLDYIYTPGIDQMRLMQWLQKENPIPGLKLATPLIASLDVTISPFIPNTIGLKNLITAVNGINVDLSTLNLGPECLELVNSIRLHDRKAVGIKRFFTQFGWHAFSVTHGLSDWLATTQIPFELVSPRISSVETESPANYVFSVSSLCHLFEDWTNAYSLSHDEFKNRVLDTCTLLELTVGSKAKEGIVEE